MSYLSSLSRRKKIAVQLAMDALLIMASFFAAMFARLESAEVFTNPKTLIVAIVATTLTLGVLYSLGLYRSLVRFLSARVLLTIGNGAMIGAALLLFSAMTLESGVPRSVPFIHAVFVFLSLSGVRFLARYLLRIRNLQRKKPVIIYGAGEAGQQLLNTLVHGPDYHPVTFIDDEPSLRKMVVSGLCVLGPASLAGVIKTTGAKVVLLAVPSMSRDRRREVVELVEDLNVQLLTIPSMSEIISGKAKISELRNVMAEDLLGRDPVVPEPELMRKNNYGKVVMVSGAGGSIGSELCRQILTERPSTLVLYEISEYALYTIEGELSDMAQRLGCDAKIVPILGTVQQQDRIEAAIGRFGVQTLYHAAAYKHVPLVEENVIEGICNNVFGTLATAQAASKMGVENFILISTDKAVRPANIMGTTKRIAELICQAFSGETNKTVFSIVRFGNVLGSSGSVIPRFRAQIEKGGPVTVTHPNINRYFMTITEASQLVIQAGAMARGGDVFVLDMGKPVKIMDLAIGMIKLHGLVPYEVENPNDVFPQKGDIPVCVTGLRKGEKLYEELLIGNDPKPTQHPRILTASEIKMTKAELMEVMNELRAACAAFDLQMIIAILLDLPVEYVPCGSTDLAHVSDKVLIDGVRPATRDVPKELHLRRDGTASFVVGH